MSNFDDLFAANTEFVKEFKSQDLTGEAKKRFSNCYLYGLSH